MRVSELCVGQSARVNGYTAGNSRYRQRLLAMGLLPGTHFSLIRVAPLGDPIEISVRGYALSLRKHEADVLHIEAICA